MNELEELKAQIKRQEISRKKAWETVTTLTEIIAMKNTKIETLEQALDKAGKHKPTEALKDLMKFSSTSGARLRALVDEVAKLKGWNRGLAAVANANADNIASSLRATIAERDAEIERLRGELGSIAKNTCCDRCQEAALVARAALSATGKNDLGNATCPHCSASFYGVVTPPPAGKERK